MADYNYTEATDTLAKQKADNAALLASQAGQESDYLNRYKGAIAGQETSSAMAKRLGTELNIPTLSANAAMLNRTVRELPQTYSAATRGFDVNANQLSRIIGQKTSELSPALTTANEALASANQTLATQMGYELSDQEKQLLPYTTEKELLTNKLARETSMYTAQNENELNTIIQKIASGIQVSEAEKDRAVQLATAERNYNLAKEQLSAQVNQGTIETIGGNKYLVNTTTGEKKLLGSATAPSTGSSVSSYLTGSTYITPTTPTTTTTPTGATSTFVKDTVSVSPSTSNYLSLDSSLDKYKTGNINLSNVDLSNISKYSLR